MVDEAPPLRTRPRVRAGMSRVSGPSLGECRHHRHERRAKRPGHRRGAAAAGHRIGRREPLDERRQRQIAKAGGDRFDHVADCRRVAWPAAQPDRPGLAQKMANRDERGTGALVPEFAWPGGAGRP